MTKDEFEKLNSIFDLAKLFRCKPTQVVNKITKFLGIVSNIFPPKQQNAVMRIFVPATPADESKIRIEVNGSPLIFSGDDFQVFFSNTDKELRLQVTLPPESYEIVLGEKLYVLSKRS